MPVLSKKYLLLISIFWVIMLSFLLITNNFDYGLTKTVRFLDKIILPVLAIGFFAPISKADTAKIVNTIIVGTLLFVFYLLAYGDLSGARASIMGSPIGSITIGRIIGMGTLGVLIKVLLTFKYNSFRTNGLYIVLLFFLIFGVMLSGSRGPFLAVIVSAIFILVFVLNGKDRINFIVSTFACAMLIVVVLYADIINLDKFSSIERLLNGVEDLGDHRNDTARLVLFKDALDAFIASSGLGIGTGGFNTLPGVFADYPHNIFLEVAAEMGIIGFLVFILIFSYTLFYIFNLKTKGILDVNQIIVIGLWFYTLFNACVSDDLTGNFYFWIFTALIWSFNNQKSKVLDEEFILMTSKKR